MDIEDALRLRLIEADPVAEMLADYETSKAVFWVLRPQGSAMPAIVLTTVSAPMDEHMRGLQSLQFMRLQLDTYAPSVIVAQQLRDKAIATMVPRYRDQGFYFRPASVLGRRDLSEPGVNGPIYRTSTDIRVRYSPA
ncbi:DUF3168 domain-containing protein [Sphingobium cupriresistens]|uniref:Uncharacterized protein n=1 Tax=Sphingobium cupriresistens LL01 TaxID=1420583 RepID=A0A0J7XSS3_9SPHN|nr:DUF3168 domain-containing protein [Sphingobium cupriresistens]KMS54719.1 hypothetical protein V473_15385 [Sphingobium cupriresistens LL01]